MMTLEQIYQLAIKMGIDSDLRGKQKVIKNQERLKEKYEQLSSQKKKEFDQERLSNPYSDTRIIYGEANTPVKRVLVGVDIELPEMLLAKMMVEKDNKKIDLCIAHHPVGSALAALDEVMDMQAEILALYGIPINIAQSVLKPRISEVSRSISLGNILRTPDAARLLKMPYLCVHTPADNLTADFLDKAIKKAKPEIVSELMKVIKEIPEYQIAIKNNNGPKMFAGCEDNYVGNIAITEITGGTEGSPKMYEKCAQAGIGTIVGMHMSETHKQEAEKNHINAVINGHIASDSIGMNLFLDELEKRGIEIIPCSGLIRVTRNKKTEKKIVKKKSVKKVIPKKKIRVKKK